ncbi:uncharacterized protein (TIGR02172 family) [Paenibacillus phyllosphaerae]|uniref:Uncharacterized protein (TIGR02172 family) n=1 Tax=Paenibacillus phyllosphaerae TaxID=274593 RepID=A0A7W5AUZ6_9BACL|nr:aminoglycoside phosphotransferase family protein [Paenibacillus phyllosphaerae]MBB3108666.1 uncharacterized protein (TIGR02172 family) [Paenibacillus phyllosphaerae]
MNDPRMGSRIGEGGCSEVYAWEDDKRIIKVAKPNTSYEALRFEYTNTKAAWDHGLPAPKPYEMTTIEGRHGLVMERIDGETIMGRFTRQLIECADAGSHLEDRFALVATAPVLHNIHREASDIQLPAQRPIIRDAILRAPYLTINEKSKLMAMLDSLPAKRRICHGDPNPNNIIMADDGRVTMIDWMNATIGNPEADLAEFILMVRYAVLPKSFPRAAAAYFDHIRENLIDLFMDTYARLSGINYADVEPWLVPLAARKLIADGISEDEKKLLVREIRRNLKDIAS